MRRRTLLKATGSSLLPMTALLGCQQAADTSQASAALPQAGDNKLEKFGLQLSTLTNLLLADFEGTLKQVAEMGYPQVEFSAMGFLGRPVEHVQALLAEYDLEAPVGRITPKLPANFFALERAEARKIYFARSQPKYFLENVSHSLASASSLGQKILVLPALGPDNFTTRAQVQNNIELMNQAGELCAREGVTFGYHNHNWEFAEVDGVIPFDEMLERTNPELVDFQLDAYWVTKGGGDLSDYLRRHAGRFSTCHLKDIDANGDFADVGDGLIDFPRFTREALAQGAQYFFVERDNPPQPALSAQRSFNYLQQMSF